MTNGNNNSKQTHHQLLYNIILHISPSWHSDTASWVNTNSLALLSKVFLIFICLYINKIMQKERMLVKFYVCVLYTFHCIPQGRRRERQIHLTNYFNVNQFVWY